MTLTPSELAELQSPEAKLERARLALRTAATRLEICLARMRACREEWPEAHAVSMIELPAWIENTRKAAES
jgi:hypothetical protein